MGNVPWFTVKPPTYPGSRIFSSITEKSCSLVPACTMGIPATIRGGGPSVVWWCPLTIASTFPLTDSAMCWISSEGGKGPACAATITTVAPRARSDSDSCAATGPPGANSRSWTMSGFVTVGVSTVVSPMTPTFRPRTSRSTEGFAQSGRSRVPFLNTLAERMG